MLEEIVIRLLRSAVGAALRDAAAATHSAAKIQRSIQFIRAHYHRPVGIAEVAAQVGFESPEHFTREFRRRFGVSPSECLGQTAR